MFIRDGENGLTAPRGEPERLIAAAVRLATDEPLRKRLRAAAREAVEAQSWEKVIARFEGDLEALAGLARTAASEARAIA
jgi:glycosyltransferase involved in cell wall biosynthesis